MTKADLVAAIATKANMSKVAAEEFLSAFLSSAESALCEDGKILLSGLGTFVVEQRKERTGRNPRTGEELVIPACKSVKFRPAKSLKDSIR